MILKSIHYGLFYREKRQQYDHSLEKSQAWRENESCALLSAHSVHPCLLYTLFYRRWNKGPQILHLAWGHMATSYRRRIQGEESLVQKCFHYTLVDIFIHQKCTFMTLNEECLSPRLLHPLGGSCKVAPCLGPGLWLHLTCHLLICDLGQVMSTLWALRLICWITQTGHYIC